VLESGNWKITYLLIAYLLTYCKTNWNRRYLQQFIPKLDIKSIVDIICHSNTSKTAYRCWHSSLVHDTDTETL